METFYAIDNEIDSIENFDKLDIVGNYVQFQSDTQLPVQPTMSTFNLNQYNGNINPITGDRIELFLKVTEECKEEKRLKISQTSIKIELLFLNMMHVKLAEVPL